MSDQQNGDQAIIQDLERWGLHTLFRSRGWLSTSGVPKYDEPVECPSCFSLGTVGQMLIHLVEVERKLQPQNSSWLKTVLRIWMSSGATHRLKNREEVPRPAHLQNALGCSAAEAKDYLYAAEMVGLLTNNPFPVSKPVGALTTLHFGLVCSDCTGLSATPHVGRRTLSPQLRRRVFFRDKHTCQECGIGRGEDVDLVLHVDHITPVSLGGTNDLDNLITLCADCNLGKSNDNLYGVLTD